MKAWTEYAARAKNCSECGFRTPLARQAERARAAARTGKLYTPGVRRGGSSTPVDYNKDAGKVGRKLIERLLSRQRRDASKRYRTRIASSAEVWRERYRTDPDFKLRQQARLRAKKLSRKAQITVLDDGTVTAALYEEHRACPYCDARLAPSNRVLDHMDPLSKGGAHSAANVLVCCKSCNTRKAAKTFVVWLGQLEARHAAKARRIYERKRGAPIEQDGLFTTARGPRTPRLQWGGDHDRVLALAPAPPQASFACPPR
jgi:5-methylcytosine-specific restriction endonuclease McrA